MSKKDEEAHFKPLACPKARAFPEQGRYPRLAACGVVAVDEAAKRVQRDACPSAKSSRRVAASGNCRRPRARLEGEAEERAVDCVEREACRPPKAN